MRSWRALQFIRFLLQKENSVLLQKSSSGKDTHGIIIKIQKGLPTFRKRDNINMLSKSHSNTLSNPAIS